MKENENGHLQGLGGWLILVIIGLVITPIRLGFFLQRELFPLFIDGSWEALTTATSPNYHALWGPLLIFEIIGNLAIIALSLVTLYFLFRKSKRTPSFAIIWISTSFVVVVADFFLAELIPAIAAMPADFETVKELIRSTVSAAIWIPYFLFSKRVKATFIE